jgi:hypothetical protein
MKPVSYITIILMLLVLPAMEGLAQEADNSDFWKGSTAYTIPKGQVEFGLLQPLRIGLSASVEVYVHPILFFVDPNLGLKIRLHQGTNLIIASTHNVYIPTPMLRLLQMKGAGGLISSQYSIPTMLTLYNGVFISKIINNSIVTLETGLFLSAGTSTLDKASSIDLPIIYPRLGSLYHQPEFLLGLNYNSKLADHLRYLLGAQTYIIPACAENFFFEQSGLVQWKPKTHFMLQVGYKLCYGRYPFGYQWTLLPDVDFVFHFGGQKGQTGNSK